MSFLPGHRKYVESCVVGISKGKSSMRTESTLKNFCFEMIFIRVGSFLPPCKEVQDSYSPCSFQSSDTGLAMLYEEAKLDVAIPNDCKSWFKMCTSEAWSLVVRFSSVAFAVRLADLLRSSIWMVLEWSMFTILYSQYWWLYNLTSRSFYILKMPVFGGHSSPNVNIRSSSCIYKRNVAILIPKLQSWSSSLFKQKFLLISSFIYWCI